jgi:hypothetical protein
MKCCHRQWVRGACGGWWTAVLTEVVVVLFRCVIAVAWFGMYMAASLNGRNSTVSAVILHRLCGAGTFAVPGSLCTACPRVCHARACRVCRWWTGPTRVCCVVNMALVWFLGAVAERGVCGFVPAAAGPTRVLPVVLGGVRKLRASGRMPRCGHQRTAECGVLARRQRHPQVRVVPRAPAAGLTLGRICCEGWGCGRCCSLLLAPLGVCLHASFDAASAMFQAFVELTTAPVSSGCHHCRVSCVCALAWVLCGIRTRGVRCDVGLSGDPEQCLYNKRVPAAGSGGRVLGGMRCRIHGRGVPGLRSPGLLPPGHRLLGMPQGCIRADRAGGACVRCVGMAWHDVFARSRRTLAVASCGKAFARCALRGWPLPCLLTSAPRVRARTVALLALLGVARWKGVNLSALGIGVDFLQVVSLFSSFGFTWPPQLTALFAASSAASFNDQLVAPECSIGTWSFSRKYVWLRLKRRVLVDVCGFCSWRSLSPHTLSFM